MADEDNFRPVFKYYKSREPRPDLSRLLRVASGEPGVHLLEPPTQSLNCKDFCALGLHPPTQWQVFAVHNHPGLLVIHGAFTPQGELFWTAKCLTEYPDSPNINNITNITSGISTHDNIPNTQKNRGHDAGSATEMSNLSKNEEDNCAHESWWKDVVNGGGVESSVCRELRWSTLGYHHNWETKVYSEDRRSAFPPCLSRLSSVIASTVATFLRTSKLSKLQKRQKSTLSRSQTTSSNNLSTFENEQRDEPIPNSNDTVEDEGSNSRQFATRSGRKSREVVEDGGCTDLNCNEDAEATYETRMSNGNNIMRKSYEFNCANGMNLTKAVMNNLDDFGDVDSNTSAIGIHGLNAEDFDEFTAEAAIVNYYLPGTSLCPHTDHSESIYTAPLLSISLGRPCVFLIGGRDKSVPPSALALRSGDVVVMGGAARLSYHAVPLVCSTDQWQQMAGPQLPRGPIEDLGQLSCTSCGAGPTWELEKNDELIRQYFDMYRININVRQVGKL
ncbi:nucleic acid dioxygenase ALKBH1-like [Hyalella azteca]|uniref:Nucleic acid dioxygenase ALKBH1-like n=1 Tax=Hyalella azteca TaxID=294128 RepID=A0A8B7N440_HYAAZ|nr:nucleic acid dioxygenase ALKBH1-like [Hyalella azteca]